MENTLYVDGKIQSIIKEGDGSTSYITITTTDGRGYMKSNYTSENRIEKETVPRNGGYPRYYQEILFKKWYGWKSIDSF